MIGQLYWVMKRSKKKSEKIEVDTSIRSYFNDAEKIIHGKYLEKAVDEKEELKEIDQQYNFFAYFWANKWRSDARENWFLFWWW